MLYGGATRPHAPRHANGVSRRTRTSIFRSSSQVPDFRASQRTTRNFGALLYRLLYTRFVDATAPSTDEPSIECDQCDDETFPLISTLSRFVPALQANTDSNHKPFECRQPEQPYTTRRNRASSKSAASCDDCARRYDRPQLATTACSHDGVD